MSSEGDCSSRKQTNDAPLQVTIVVCVLVFAALPLSGFKLFWLVKIAFPFYVTSPPIAVAHVLHVYCITWWRVYGVILGYFFYTTPVDTEFYLTKPWVQNNLVWCGQGLRVADANRLKKLIRMASDVVGEELDTLTAVSDRRLLLKLQVILQHGTHPLHNALIKQRSTFSERLIAPKCTTECHRKSFLPGQLCNSSCRWFDSNSYL